MVSAQRLPTPERPRVVVTVATFNGRHLLETFLPSVEQQTFREFRVVVVDDASSDDTVEWLTHVWPDVEIVGLEQNGGVTRAFNVGIRAAWDGEMIGLFNNDMELAPECLQQLVDALDQYPGAGSVGAKLLNYYERDVIDGAGDLFDWAGTGTRRGHGEQDTGQYDEAREIFGACAGAALYRRTAFEQVGLFDERFYAFFEDVDWSLRAQLAGRPARYAPSAVAFHMGSATLGRGMTDFTRYQLTRNSLWILAKDYPVSALVRHSPRILYVQAAAFVVAVRGRQLRVWMRATRDAFRALPAVLRDRREVQRTRTAPLREVEEIVAAR
ncbi:glycosyltransferase family 2 protein [Patulibacter sp.]|uniref:glycosyltransferase family 2 protein n=1 Tax=Patulibacter sp. TaxID=1912859 RepID=UPI00271705EC|nr:glycosyltransferase family 2 protein [Patulibacter sp.]MDO9408198.1 glycosyltransferase family 2 protein [Patulibacter sp.]